MNFIYQSQFSKVSCLISISQIDINELNSFCLFRGGFCLFIQIYIAILLPMFSFSIQYFMILVYYSFSIDLTFKILIDSFMRSKYQIMFSISMHCHLGVFYLTTQFVSKDFLNSSLTFHFPPSISRNPFPIIDIFVAEN